MASLIDTTYVLLDQAQNTKENLKKLNSINIEELTPEEFIEYEKIVEELEMSITKIDYLLKMTETVVLPENKRRLNTRDDNE